MALFIFTKVILFWGVLIYFGWNFTRFFLRENKIEVLLVFSTVIGSMFYIFLLNALGYVFDIVELFYILILFLFLAGLFLHYPNRREKKIEWMLDIKWRKIFLSAIIIIFITTGLVATRGYAGDEINIFSTVPMASTIAAGDFPVHWTVNPEVKVYYHYGIELFSAAMFKTTGLPIWYAVDICRAIFTTLFFALLFIILLQALKKPAKAMLVSLIAVFGGGFIFLYGIEAIEVFYKIFVLGETVAYPWKFLHNATTSGVAGPLIKDIHIQSIAPSFVLIISGVWFYFKSVAFAKIEKYRLSIVAIVINIILLSALALIGETFLLVVLIAFGLYPFLILLLPDRRKDFKIYLVVTLSIAIFVLLISSVQGGVLTELFRQNYDRSPKISSNWFYYSYEKLGYIWSNKSIINFGLPLFLVLPCLYLLFTRFKKSGYYDEIGQIILITFGCFAVPFVIELGPLYDYEMARYLYLAPPFWSMIIGLILADIIIDNKKVKEYLRGLSYLAVILIVLNGVLFQIVFMIIPIGRTQDRFSPFFFNFPKPTVIEQGVYDWAKNNTTVKDYFLTYSSDKDNFNEYNKKIIVFAGRVAPQYDYLNNHRFMNRDERTQELVDNFIKLEKSCDSEYIKKLQYKYLYVNNYWPVGLEEKCLNNNDLELKYEDNNEDEFARVYKVKY